MNEYAIDPEDNAQGFELVEKGGLSPCPWNAINNDTESEKKRLTELCALNFLGRLSWRRTSVVQTLAAVAETIYQEEQLVVWIGTTE